MYSPVQLMYRPVQNLENTSANKNSGPVKNLGYIIEIKNSGPVQNLENINENKNSGPVQNLENITENKNSGPVQMSILDSTLSRGGSPTMSEQAQPSHGIVHHT